MNRWLKVLVTRILMVLCLFLWGCFLSTPINITGTWTGEMTWTSGPVAGFVYPLTLTLVHEDRTVTGTVTLHSHSTFNFDLPIVQGSARSVNISLIARGANTHVPNDPIVEFQVDGQYEQTTMSGNGTQSIDGSVYSFNWQAVLVTEPVVPASF